MIAAPSDGADDRDRGIEQILANNAAAALQLRRVFLELLLEHDPEPVSFDQVRKRIRLPATVHFNLYGATAFWCMNLGIAEPIGVVRSQRPSAHRAKIQLWKLVHRAKAESVLDAFADIELPGDDEPTLFDDLEGDAGDAK